QDFQDSELNKLIEEAMDRAPDIRTAIARVEAGRAARMAAVAGLFPTLDATGSYEKQKFHENTLLMPNEKLYQAGLSIAWDVDIFGKKSREIEAASAQEAQLKAELENVMISVVTEVGSAYVGLRTAQYLLQKTRDDLKIQKALAGLTQDKYKSGLSNAIDVNQAEYQLATTQAVIPKLEMEIETYQNTLAVLTGRPAGSLQKRLKPNKRNLITMPFRFPIKKLSTLPADVVRYRPDVFGMEEALKAQNARVGQAISSLFPTISLAALFGFESVHLNRLTNNSAQKRSYQASVNAPLFHFGVLWQNVKIEEANMKAEVASYEKTLLNATKEIRDILVGLKKMESRHKNLEMAWHKMDAAAKLARHRYESGLIDYFQVLDAEERRIAAQSEVITSAGALYQNILNFYKAIGGQFTFDRIQAAQSQ
ncbi:MAG: efflux transporter outer membrane subunit, partial [Alphaproteobacteria bacterium]|nr:efflux transporter outer membrane subunit [Alphaproteobacteria bacterium]